MTDYKLNRLQNALTDLLRARQQVPAEVDAPTARAIETALRKLEQATAAHVLNNVTLLKPLTPLKSS